MADSIPSLPEGKIRILDPSNLQFLKERQEQDLQRNETQIEQWMKFNDDYVSLKSRLQTLPDQITYDMMVPVGTQALMRGKMVHTNEILVLLGDNWFVKRSAKQALEICGRRIKSCEEMLEKLQKEKVLLISWKNETQLLQEDIMDGTEKIEIVEVYDDEDENKWREEHREKVRQYHRKLAELKKNQKEPTTKDEVLWNRLEQLELQEEMEDELAKLGVEDEEFETIQEATDEEDSSSDDDSPDLSATKVSSQQHSDEEMKVGVTEDLSSSLDTPENSKILPSERKSDERPQTLKLQKKKSEERKVSFCSVAQGDERDDEIPETLRITFKHSPQEHVKDFTSLQNTEISAGSDSASPLQSPADIYTHFADFLRPKSILKVKSSPTVNVSAVPHPSEGDTKRLKWLDQEDSVPIVNVGVNGDVCEKQKVESPVPIAFADVVIEHKPTEAVPPKPPSQARPSSKFRSARQASKR